jgi:hypothetical protein
LPFAVWFDTPEASPTGDFSPEALQLSLQTLSSSSFESIFGGASSAGDASTTSSTPASSSSSSSSSALSWWQIWMKADWHLLQLPTSLRDVMQLGTAIRTIGKALFVIIKHWLIVVSLQATSLPKAACRFQQWQ